MAFNPDPGKKLVVLFWNLDGKPLVEAIGNLVEQHAVDIVLLAESPFEREPQDLLDRLNEVPRLPHDSMFLQPDAPTATRVQVFTRLQGAQWTVVTNHSRYTIWNVTLPGGRRFLCAASHFPSIQYDQGDGQRECGLSLRLDLEKAETGWADPLSFVIGDLNANPFDAGIAGIYGLNATQSRRISQGEPRGLNGRTYAWLYNPMWRFLGSNQPGTYYGRLPAPICYDWFLLDQVLVRPAMICLFDNDGAQDVVILKEFRGQTLVQNGTQIPNDRMYSKHLPLLFRFYLPEE